MKQNKETKIKLLASARAEFLEKGYLNASLRNICKNAGVTTGALYFFFKDKADLYKSVVKDTVDIIYTVMNEHFTGENDSINAGELDNIDIVDNSRDIEDAKRIIHIMYERRDEVLLILTKSQGSPYEGILDTFIEKSEKQFIRIAEHIEKLNPGNKIDRKFIHWISHQMIEVFVYVITHIEEEEQAMKFIEQNVLYMTSGWYGLFKKQ